MEQRDYVRRLLDAYRVTPGTCGAVRRPDRVLAGRLHQRGVPLEAVENAFVLAAARRLIRPAGAAPLGTIRSLAYFSPVIEEAHVVVGLLERDDLAFDERVQLFEIGDEIGRQGKVHGRSVAACAGICRGVPGRGP